MVEYRDHMKSVRDYLEQRLKVFLRNRNQGFSVNRKFAEKKYRLGAVFLFK